MFVGYSANSIMCRRCLAQEAYGCVCSGAALMASLLGSGAALMASLLPDGSYFIYVVGSIGLHSKVVVVK
jgi:hypothetical protein